MPCWLGLPLVGVSLLVECHFVTHVEGSSLLVYAGMVCRCGVCRFYRVSLILDGVGGAISVPV